MNSDVSPPGRSFPIAPIVIFPLVGPIAIVALMAVPLAVIGLFALGPGGLLYYIALGSWWLPGLYALLGPPFLVAGLFFAIAGFIFRRRSLLVALAAGQFAFMAYFGAWLLMPERFESMTHDYANLRAGFFGAMSVLAVMLGTLAAWFVARAVTRRVALGAPDYGSGDTPWHREGLILLGIVLIGAAGHAGVLAAIPRLPAQAWKDCSGTSAGSDERIRGCTVIAERTDETAERRATAYFRRGYAYESAYRDYGRAIPDYTEAIRLNPQLAEAYSRRGLAYAQRGEFAKAVPDFDEALRLRGDNITEDLYQVFRYRALARARAGDLDGAIADHSQEIRLVPRFADGYLHRAAAYRDKGDTARAITDFSDAIRIEPYRAEGYVGRGSVYVAQGDLDRGLADFDEAIRRRPDLNLTAPAYRKRGEVLEKKGDLTGALAAFEKAVSLNPSDKEALAARDRVRGAPKQ